MLIDNTLFLRNRFPQLRKTMLENEYNIADFQVIDSKSGPKTIQVEIESDKQRMIHSMYDPVREAERIIASHADTITEDTHVFFYGIGMGYHVERFISQFPGNSYSLFEPVPEIFSAMTANKLLQEMATENLKALYIDYPNNTDAYIHEFQRNNKAIHIIMLPSYETVFPEQTKKFREKIKQAILDRRTNLYTNVNYQKRWIKNSFLNFEHVLQTPNLLHDDIGKQFEGKPAIIVSAGPSLKEEIDNIRYIKEHNLAYIFSVGSAINSLLEFDILPDAVFTYDPSETNQNVFKKMIEKGIEDIPMVFGSSVGYETLQKYKGPKMHFITTQDRTSFYFLEDQLNVEKDLILDAPSIAVMTFQILNKLGASPIIFAGQNLGYLHNRLYSEGVTYDHIQSTIDKEQLEHAITTLDVYGNEIKTNVGFNKMREGIESFADYYKATRFINTTKGGAAIKGVPFQPLEEVIQSLLDKPLDTKIDAKLVPSYEKKGIQKKYTELQKSIQSFHALLKRFEGLIVQIKTSTAKKQRVEMQKHLQSFDSLYAEMVKNTYFNYFLSYFIRVHVTFLSNEINELNGERDFLIKGKRIAASFATFLQQCKNGSRELEDLIPSVIEGIQD
ncbi:motility associated factor glycosyltransferase family protein [Virgibacillus sp. MG-45]|uniref:motility associated factor glycosyltransferase family protein n=1 Tax=Virgibacillus sp. MG-45 TaxID=3102791 RepID=UPI002ED8B47B